MGIGVQWVIQCRRGIIYLYVFRVILRLLRAFVIFVNHMRNGKNVGLCLRPLGGHFIATFEIIGNLVPTSKTTGRTVNPRI